LTVSDKRHHRPYRPDYYTHRVRNRRRLRTRVDMQKS